jgi:hypothetical protein
MNIKWKECTGDEEWNKVVLGWSTQYEYVLGCDFPASWEVTHWMPLPEPPKPQKVESHE